MPKDLTVTALAMWGLFALGVIVGTCYCYYSDNHIDETQPLSIILNTPPKKVVCFLFPKLIINNYVDTTLETC